ncbi:MAG: (Fe-S)-binding protein [Myxococcota bacterium]
MKSSPLSPHEDALTVCTYCPSLCQHTCPVATAEGSRSSTPWALMSLAHHVQTNRLRLDDAVAERFYHCAGCRACTRFCDHSNDVEQAMVAARAFVVERARLPFPKAALQPPGADERDPWWQGHSGKGFADRFQGDPAVLLLPGHKSLIQDARLVAQFLEICGMADDDEIACSEASTLDVGYDLWSAGLHEDFRKQARAVRESLRGASHVVVMSPEALYTLRDVYPRFGMRIAAELHHASEFLLRFVGGVDLYPVEGRVAYHDACHLARHLGTMDVPREILRSVLAAPPIELRHREAQTVCCGGTGCLPVTCLETSKGMAEGVIQLALQAGAERLATFAAECVPSLQAAADGRLQVVHGMELVHEALRGHDGA